MEAPKRGRPRKDPTEGTEKQKKNREYMRKYQSEIKAGITQLEKDEMDCLKELDKIRKERKKLIDELDKANKQAEGILKEKVAKK
jgi:soluble cytochrome b562